MLTNADFPEEPVMHIECEERGTQVPVHATLKTKADGLTVKLTPDTTDAAAHYLTHG